MTLSFLLEIQQGVTWACVFPVVDSNGELVTVTGCIAVAQVRRGPGEPLLHEWSAVEANIIVIGQSVTLTLDPDVTSAWPWTTAQYDIELTEPSGARSRIAEGPVRVSPEITR